MGLGGLSWEHSAPLFALVPRVAHKHGPTWPKAPRARAGQLASGREGLVFAGSVKRKSGQPLPPPPPPPSPQQQGSHCSLQCLHCWPQTSFRVCGVTAEAEIEPNSLTANKSPFPAQCLAFHILTCCKQPSKTGKNHGSRGSLHY